jgi:hypothetical protein
MSHINNIGGGSVAAEYRDYLARLGARRKGTDEPDRAGTGVLRTFDSAIDPDREPDGGGGEEPEEDPEGEEPQVASGAEADDESGLLGKA